MKQGIYTGVMTLANVASERIFKDEKVLDALKRELKGDLVNYVKNLSAQNINKAAIKKLVTEKLLKYGGQVLKESNKEAFEELVVQAVDEAMQSTMGAEGYDGDKALQRIGDTYATTMLYGGIVSGLAAKSNMAADKFNRVQIYKMATNPATYQKEIQRQFEAGEITNAEKSEKLDLLYKAAEIAAAEPPKVAALPTKKKAEYLTQQLNIAVNEGLLEGAKDPNLQAELKTNIEESQKRAKAIYESEPEVLEEITKPKPTEDDTLLEKIKSSERVNGSEQTADLDYFIGKVGEAPIASQRFGEGVVEQLLPRVPTEKLQENYDFIVKVDPESAEADAIAKELDRREQQENPPIDQVREMADENTPDEVVSESEAGSGGVGGESKIAKRIRDNIKELPEKDFDDAEANKNWNDIRESRKKIKSMSDEELLKEVQKGMDGKKINQAIYESYFGMDITAKDIEAELQSLKDTTKAETPTPKDGNTSNVGGDVRWFGSKNEPLQDWMDISEVKNPNIIHAEKIRIQDGMGLLKEDKEGNVYTTKQPANWDYQLSYEKGKNVPSNIYIAFVKNPSTEGSEYGHETASPSNEVSILKYLGSLDDFRVGGKDSLLDNGQLDAIRIEYAKEHGIKEQNIEFHLSTKDNLLNEKTTKQQSNSADVSGVTQIDNKKSPVILSETKISKILENENKNSKTVGQTDKQSIQFDNGNDFKNSLRKLQKTFPNKKIIVDNENGYYTSISDLGDIGYKDIVKAHHDAQKEGYDGIAIVKKTELKKAVDQSLKETTTQEGKVAELEAARDMAILREKVPEMKDVNDVVPTREAVSAGSNADNLTANKRKRAELKNRYTELQKLLGCLMK